MTGSRHRRLRPTRVAAGASLIGVATTAAALAAGPASAQEATVLQTARHIAPGRQLTVRGTTSPTDAGQSVLLQFERAGSNRWRSIARARVGRRGRFTLRAPLMQSGRVRVIGAATTPRAAGFSTAVAEATVAPSIPRRVSVGSLIELGNADHNLGGGRSLTLPGRLLPATAGRWVRLEGLASGRWKVLTIARTGPRGGFTLHYRPSPGGPTGMRVAWGGDRLNTGSYRGAGSFQSLHPAVASWYDDSGATACGYHAGYGVANLSLPCGTQVVISYGGRSVTATVDDRGPYVGGREYDLNQNVAGALGFSGVDTVWVSR